MMRWKMKEIVIEMVIEMMIIMVVVDGGNNLEGV